MMITADRCPPASKRAKRIAVFLSMKTPSMRPSRSRAVQRPRRLQGTMKVRGRPTLNDPAKWASCAMARILLREFRQLGHREPEAENDRQRAEGKQRREDAGADDNIAKPTAPLGAAAQGTSLRSGSMMICVKARHGCLFLLHSPFGADGRQEQSPERDITSRRSGGTLIKATYRPP